MSENGSPRIELHFEEDATAQHALECDPTRDTATCLKCGKEYTMMAVYARVLPPCPGKVAA